MSAEYPLRWPDGWPRRHGSLGDLAGASPRRSGGTRETISVDAATRRLRDELWRIPATDVVITMDKGGRGGVAAYFRIGADRMALAQDGYRSTADNARSLAIAVNGMRAATRHGGDFMQKRAFSGFTPSTSHHWRRTGPAAGGGSAVKPENARFCMKSPPCRVAARMPLTAIASDRALSAVLR